VTLQAHLAQWDRRRRLAGTLAWAPRGLAAGLAVATVIAVAARLWPLLSTPWLLALAALWALLGSLAAALVVWLWPATPLELARAFDRRLGLRERVSTALELESGALVAPAGLAERQRADALRAAAAADPVAAIPLRLARRDGLLALAALALLAAAIWVPNPMQARLAERAAVREAVEAQIEEIEALRDEIAADPALSEADRAALLEVLDSTVERLQAGDLTREEALAELTEAGQQLRQLGGEDALAEASALQAAGEGLRESAVTDALGAALEQGDFATAAAILEDLSDELGQALTRDEELALAEQLDEAAAELAASNPELAGQFSAAAEAIRRGEIEAAREALAQASATTNQTGQAAAAAQAAQAAAGQLAGGGQQIAQAGAAGQGGQGSAGQGGTSQGAGQGQSSQGTGGAGQGESNAEAQGGAAQPMETDNGPGDGGLRQFEPLYAPQRLGGSGGPELELPPGGDPGELLRELPGNPEVGESTVPYNQIYALYREAAGRALSDQRIPLGLRETVRDYFSSLEP
jgi:hypothetical protein